MLPETHKRVGAALAVVGFGFPIAVQQMNAAWSGAIGGAIVLVGLGLMVAPWLIDRSWRVVTFAVAVLAVLASPLLLSEEPDLETVEVLKRMDRRIADSEQKLIEQQRLMRFFSLVDYGMRHDFNREGADTLQLGACPDVPCYRITLRYWDLDRGFVKFSLGGNFPGCFSCGWLLGVEIPLQRECWGIIESRQIQIRIFIEDSNITNLSAWVGVVRKTTDEQDAEEMVTNPWFSSSRETPSGCGIDTIPDDLIHPLEHRMSAPPSQ